MAIAAPEDGQRAGVKRWAIDPDQAARLWDLSVQLTGENAFR